MTASGLTFFLRPEYYTGADHSRSGGGKEQYLARSDLSQTGGLCPRNGNSCGGTVSAMINHDDSPGRWNAQRFSAFLYDPEIGLVRNPPCDIGDCKACVVQCPSSCLGHHLHGLFEGAPPVLYPD